MIFLFNDLLRKLEAIDLKVKIYGMLRLRLSQGEVDLELPSDSTVEDLITHLSKLWGQDFFR